MRSINKTPPQKEYFVVYIQAMVGDDGLEPPTSSV
jgi:hypothetical protein